ncbi:DEAD/DEAH box helicase [Natronobacterium gregoryi]|uniref:DEAD/H associated domain-containing protein n=2 Tax=Natronobacterium gregoryi TaxID=44930 RepID=L0AMV7_NATGS|nr:DEAD/DEAH box helicase [Natronobacterium gregoryi]AFZ74410.1 Lhr-like helicase [Natronobacterium gregoryi SP2]ELY72130.1 DEAD/H associated domain-containing protein [Natronobacterium gregoryi SP2]PLK19740.1 helicase [Natronobacterium gregoryi SP2]SFJ40416.1 ATP-dependent helicase Lhr and Lhr-like helicase [Natronobacterium gregoryi]
MTDGDVAAFTHLGPTVRGALSERGFSRPTAPQRLAIPPLAAGQNTLVIAPTGSGKTETAMLPVLDDLVAGEGPPNGFGALYITPLRALNRDMRERLEWWGEYLDLAVDVRHGDTTDYQRSKQATDPPDVLVTTPETLQAMLTGERLRDALQDVSHVVIDEVHELAASKRGAQLSIALERLRDLGGSFQRIGLSATVGDPEEVGNFLTGSRPCEIREIDVGSNVDVTVREPEITEEDEELAGRLLTESDTASHVRLIRDLVAEHESTLIFVNTRQTAEALGSRFKELDLPIGVHHGSLSKEARIDVEDRFKAGELDGLLCTSSMELGIDVGSVDHVIQYQSPRQVTRLLQRIGRAGHRQDEVSNGTIVTTRPDDTFEAVAIARRARAGEVEPAAIHEGSLDVVANQIPGIVQSRGDTRLREAYETVSRAYPFRDLCEETFREVVSELDRNRIVWFDESEAQLETTGGTWQYVYSNLSMIPDEETYEVHDIASSGQIGTLDERFVVNFAEPGEIFVQRGEMWRISEIDDEEARVKVSPIENPGGEVPSWIGQEIPVPTAVAQEVGEIRAVAQPQLQTGADATAVGRELASRYPADKYTLAEACEQLERQIESESPMPTADRIVLERQGRTIVVNAPYGHTANETLGRSLSALLGQRAGSSVGLETDPYRIELEVPTSIATSDVLAVLEETEPNHVETIVELGLKNSDALAFRLAQVSAKFGALKRWQGGSAGRLSNERLLAALEGTPMYEEAIREVFHEDLDIERASAVLEGIQSGEIELLTHRGRTPVGQGGRGSGGKELLAPENADASVIETVRERIQNDRVILLCTHCNDWKVTTKVKRVRDQPECPDCGSTRIASLNPWADEVVQAVRAAEKDDEQEKMTERAYRAASLVQSHGKQAVIAMAARGVGPHNAAQIINKLREDESEFYRDILSKEREYARTQSFWD